MRYKLLLSTLVVGYILLGCTSTDPISEPNKTEKVSTKNTILDSGRIESPPVTDQVQLDSNYCFLDYQDGPKFGFKNKEGKVIIPAKFDFAGDFYEGLAPVVKGSKHGFCDSSGQIKFELNKVKFAAFYNELSGEPFLNGNAEGYFMVTNAKGKFGFVNSHAEQVIPCKFYSLEAFSEKLAAFSDGKKMGYIDTLGNIIIPAKYERAFAFSEGLAAVRLDNGKVGYINTYDTMIVPAIYYYGFSFSEGLAVVSKTIEYGNFYFINKTGQTVLPGPYDEADSFKNGEALVFKRGKCRYIDKTGKQLRTAGTQCFQGC